MVNRNNQKVKEVVEQIHEGILRKSKRRKNEKEDIIIENKVFSILCRRPDIEPSKCAIALKERYGYELSGDEVIQIFRTNRIANQHNRKELLQWAEKIAEYFAGAVNGDRASYDRFEKLRKEPALKNGKHLDMQERIAAIMIYEKYPEIDLYEDAERLHMLRNVLAKYFVYDIADAISDIYGFPKLRDEKKKDGEEAEARAESKMTLEEAVKKINQLENALERTNTMLTDLQDEFAEQLEESKIKELADFFARLNSEKYGCILDELLVVRKGMEELRKKNYELPIEINGLLIMVKKLVQFVRDCHIEPILKINSTQEVFASDVEFCNYEGSPFQAPDDIKTVKVVSPGWIYKDKEVQISRPKVKEED